VTIDICPDDVLLEIFYFYGGEHFTTRKWKTLVDVCRRWRNVVFASPQYLNLLLICDGKTPAATLLDIWPPLPIAVQFYLSIDPITWSTENIIAALERHDRISSIEINDPEGCCDWERVTAAMLEPLPALTHAHILFTTTIFRELDLPDAFLGGYAPRLRSFTLTGIGFLALPKLLSSTSHLVSLSLYDIPCAGYISPETMVTCLTSLPNLESFHLSFYVDFGQYLPHPPTSEHPPIRAILPSLTDFSFESDGIYLEELVARIDAPLLIGLEVNLFYEPTRVTPTAQLCQFIARTERLGPFDQAEMNFDSKSAKVILGSRTVFKVDSDVQSEQVLLITPVLKELSPLFSCVDSLKITGVCDYSPSKWGYVDNETKLLNFLRLFIAVQSLHVSRMPGLYVAHTLRELAREAATEVLPALRILTLPQVQVEDVIEPFLAMRQLSNQPVTVHWEQVHEHEHEHYERMSRLPETRTPSPPPMFY